MAVNEKSKQRTASALVVSAVGTLALTVHVFHFGSTHDIHSWVFGVAFPLVTSMVLVAAGGWLYRSDFAERLALRIVAWMGVGLCSGVAFGYPVVPYQASHGVAVADLPFMLVTWMTTGAVGGFVIGVYDARQKQLRAALEEKRSVLAARERELERQNDRLDRFASILSHDLRNPLNVATGRLTLAMAEYDSEHLDAVEIALARMETLIEDSLTLARQGDPVTDTQPLAFESIATQAWAVIQTGEATMTVEENFTLQADPDRLQQLLENVFRNAIDHSDGSVSIRVGPIAETAGFYVADDGPGIPANERQEVFEPGYSTAENGTGLGLAIVSEITDAHGWDATVTESGEGGARFEISWQQE